jgi:predicted nucleotidyltransferase
MNRFGLTDRELELIGGVFERHPEVVETRIFGSRAKGNSRPNSDIDLALFGHIAPATLAAVAGELDDLPLPYAFDVQAHEAIRHRPLREHIDRVGQSLYVRKDKPALEQGDLTLKT